MECPHAEQGNYYFPSRFAKTVTYDSPILDNNVRVVRGKTISIRHFALC